MPANLADPDSFRRWTFGDVRVTRVLDLPPTVCDVTIFLPTTRDEVIGRLDWLYPDFATSEGDIVVHFQAFVIEAQGKRIMVDPCVGNDKPRQHPLVAMRDGPFLRRLADAGFPRESIDVVLCTHMHVDHCGWNTMLVEGHWVPTFPNARYLFAKAEFAHARADDTGDAQAIFEDSIRPIFDAGLADLVPPDHVIVEGIRLEPTPGHTPGHCSVAISSRGSEALITGDILHHPLQAAMPHISSHFCWDPEEAVATRRKILDRIASRNAVMLGTHFSGPTAVNIRADGDAWRVKEA